jgi:hypothetical protein
MEKSTCKPSEKEKNIAAQGENPFRVSGLSEKKWVGMRKLPKNCLHTKVVKDGKIRPFSCKKGDASGREGVKLRD